jgi:hypothetical protein
VGDTTALPGWFTGYNGANVLNDFYEFRFEPVVIPPPTLAHKCVEQLMTY